MDIAGMAAERIERETAARELALSEARRKEVPISAVRCECGELIEEARRRAVPGVRLCMECAEASEREQARYAR